MHGAAEEGVPDCAGAAGEAVVVGGRAIDAGTTELNLSYKRLSALPESFGRLAGLTTLRLNNNPLTQPPLEVCRRGVAAIEGYFAALRAQGAVGTHVGRWMFVGYERVGKTTLAKALSGAAFDADEPSTDGVSVREVAFPLPSQPATSLRVSLWDFAGQRVYYLTHQFFLSPRAMYLLLWKWRSGGGFGQAQLFFWLRSIAAQAPAAPVFVIGTHGAGCGAEEAAAMERAREQLRRAFPTLQLQFHIVDSCTGLGIDTLKTALLEHAEALPTTRLDVPTQWLELKQKVADAADAAAGAPLLSLADFGASIGAGCPQVEDALALWHDLGSLLWFREHKELRSVVVLRPQWLADAFRCVITQREATERIRANDGRMRRDQVLNLFRAVTDSARFRLLLLELLVHFEIAHSVDGELIFPYLLPEAAPEEPEPESEAADPSQRLVDVRLPFIPRGLMGRVLCGLLRL